MSVHSDSWRLAASGAAIWAALAVASTLGPWRLLENKGFDLLSVLTADRPFASDIIIVGIDEPSFAELRHQWPWPRGMHGQLVEQLAQAGAAVIAFDVVFAEASDAAQDEYFAGAIRDAGNVVLAADVATQETEHFDQVIRVEPHHVFRQAGAASGVAAVTLDSDLVLRTLPVDASALWRAVLRRHPLPAYRAAAERPLAAGSRIRYAGPDHTFAYISYYQGLDPQTFLPPGFLKDRIVLIGRDVKASPTGGSQADLFATPFSVATARLTPGAEVHANAIHTMLRDRSIREVPYAAMLLVLALAATVAAFGMRRWRPARSAAVGLALAAIVAVAGWWLFARHGFWMPMLAPMAAVGLTYVSRGGAAFLHEQRRRREIKTAFSRYVSPEVVNDLIAHPEKLVLGGVRRELTLLFTDLAGFTSVSEGLSPEDVAGLINRHMTEMTKTILAHGGTVDKFIGDAVMAFWNAPLEDPDHALHACQTALAMQAAMTLMRVEFEQRGLPAVHMRIGVHTGAAVVGNMGSEDRFDYTAIGDNVNLAARLEGVNKLYGTEILVSEAIATALAGRLPLRLVDRVKVKGKALAVDIYTLKTDERIDGVHRAAIAAYRDQNWSQSVALWEALLRIEPDDSIAKVYLARIPGLCASPPADPWDGSMAMEKM